MWDRLVSKYAKHKALSLLKLKSKFINNKMKSIKKDSDEKISNLEGLRIEINEFNLKCSMTDEDLMIHVLNNLSKEYDVILDGLEKHLTVSGDNVLTIEVICKNYSWYKTLKTKMKKKEKKRP